jgi:hypothetical protein
LDFLVAYSMEKGKKRKKKKKLYAIIRDSGNTRWYRTVNGAWFTLISSFYKPRLYEEKIDAKIAKNWIEMRERRENLKIIKTTIRKIKAQY